MHQRIKEAAMPLMRKLHRTFNETVNLGVREGLTIRYVDYLETTRPLRLFVRPGQSDPLFSTALGRAVLSILPDDEVSRLLAALQKESGSSPKVRPQAFKALLATARKRGWAEEQDETVKGISCGAVSLQALGYPDAAVSMTVPSVRYNEACRHALEALFKEFRDHTK